MRLAQALLWFVLLGLNVATQDLISGAFANWSVALGEGIKASSGTIALPNTKGEQIRGFGTSKLVKRQSECEPSSYLPCPNLPGKCCPAGEDCFSEGCCLSGLQPCGDSKCYDPKTEICCSSGTSCPIGYDCLSGGGCCPSGQELCGNSNCYDPKTEICCSSGTSCPIGYDCLSGGFCCPLGQERCGNSKRYDPETEICCTSPGEVWGCPLTLECCTIDGASPCYNPSTESCCSGGSCDKASTSASTAPVPTPSATRTIEFRYDPNRKVTAKDGEVYPAQNKAVLQNMCLGIKQYTGQTSQSITLTRASETERGENRKNMCPEGFCKDAWKEYVEKFYPDGINETVKEAITMAQDMSCDEFPFAISAEGGSPGTEVGTGRAICIPSSENSWQGGVMGNHFKGEKIKVGQKFTVKIVGFDCETLMPDASIVRRDVNATSIGAESLWMAYDSEDLSKNLITLPLGDLDNGDYRVSLNITGGNLSISDFQVLTYDGQEIQSEVLDNWTISFSLNESEDAVSVIGITTLVTGFEITYDSQKVVSSTQTPVPSQTWTGGNPWQTWKGGVPWQTWKGGAPWQTWKGGIPWQTWKEEAPWQTWKGGVPGRQTETLRP